jgi:hypothetical protein
MQSKYKAINAAEVFKKLFLRSYGTIEVFSKKSGIKYLILKKFLEDPNTLDANLDSELSIFLDIPPLTLLHVQQYYNHEQSMRNLCTPKHRELVFLSEL